VLALGIAAVAAFDLAAHGVALTPPVPRGLPSIAVPSLDGAGGLMAAAAGIALMAFVESISAARTFRRRDDAPIDSDQELRALGAAGIASSFSGAYPVSGGLSQTAVNDGAGARTQAAELVTAGMVLLTLTLLAPLFDDLAEATLGALVVVAAAGLIDFDGLARLRRLSVEHWVVAVVPLTGVLLFGTLQGVLIGVVLSLLVLLSTLNHPRLVTIVRAPDGSLTAREDAAPMFSAPGVAVLGVILPVYYANARRTLDCIETWLDAFDTPPRFVILDFVAQVDAGPAFIDLLRDVHETLGQRNTELCVTGLPRATEDLLRRSADWTELETRIAWYPSMEAALREIAGA
jgi:sulfate permease, SulP family